MTEIDGTLPRRPTELAGLRELIGVELGPTDPLEIAQERIDRFAADTEDVQWIHVDPDRAAAGPFGTTIAHGLLTLALGPRFSAELLDLSGFAHSLNYGYGKVRFPAPVPVGSRLRMTLTLTEVTESGGSIALTLLQTFTREGESKPVCVAEALARVFDKS